MARRAVDQRLAVVWGVIDAADIDAVRFLTAGGARPEIAVALRAGRLAARPALEGRPMADYAVHKGLAVAAGVLVAPEDDIVDEDDPRPSSGFQGIARIPAAQSREAAEEQGGRRYNSPSGPFVHYRNLSGSGILFLKKLSQPAIFMNSLMLFEYRRAESLSLEFSLGNDRVHE